MQNGNLAQLLAVQALEAGWRDKPAYNGSHVMTHGQIHDGGARLGELLKSRGLSSGDRVLLCLPDSPELVQLLLGCLSRGIVAFLANPELNRQDHAFVESDSEPALVVTTEALLDRFSKSSVAYAGELSSDAGQVEPTDYELLSGAAHAYATYTSGTTGAPKAAVHRHSDVSAFVDAMCHRALRLTSEDTGLCSAPMYFAYGLGNSVWFPLATGGSTVITQWPVSAEATATLSARFKPSVLYGVPTFFARVVDVCSPDSFRSLRCLVSAGEALEIRLAERLMEFFGGIPILDGIGSTEVGQTFLSNTIEDWRLGTVGKALPPYEIRVVTPDGATAGPGVDGDLWVRGPSISPGYWNSTTNLPMREGAWLDTQDRVCIDSDGWVEYRCRADDTEIVGGVNINPREIERLITEDDSVAESAVVGVKDSVGASALQAFLVPTNHAVMDESVIRDIHRRLLVRLSAFQVPHRFVTVERLPRTPTGKLLRDALRAESAATPIWEVPAYRAPSDTSVQLDYERASDDQNGRRTAGDVTLSERLAVLQQEHHRLVVETVCAEVASMLGQPRPQTMNQDLAFSELGFDSQMTVELRNRLAAVTGLRLPDTVGWDYGSISELAQYVEAEFSQGNRGTALRSSATVDEPVAIVGMGCRFPGGVDSAPGLWEMVSEARDVVSEFPTDRGWDLNGLFDPDPDVMGKTYTRCGGFIADIAGFDAGFFGIPPGEALAMDPQQRLMLECSWEAVRAGRDRSGIVARISNRGVHRHLRPKLWVRRNRQVGGLWADWFGVECGLGTGGVRTGATGTGGVNGYGVLLVVGVTALGGAVVAVRGV